MLNALDFELFSCHLAKLGRFFCITVFLEEIMIIILLSLNRQCYDNKMAKLSLGNFYIDAFMHIYV